MKIYHKKRKLTDSSWPYLLLCITFIIQQSCNPPDKGSNSGVFHYNQVNYVTSLDPAFAKTQNNIWVIEHLFNQLLDLNDSMEVIPEIAVSWNVSEDGLTYYFTIRNDIYFHSDPCFGEKKTRALTASDIEFSFNRILDPKVNSPGSWIFRDKVDILKPFEAPNDSVFIIHLSRPFSPLLKMLTMQYCSVIPNEAINFYGNDFNKHPVGTSAFRLKKWLGRRGIFLERNPDYFKKEYPLLKGIRISFIEDRNTAYLEFIKNQIDFFSGLQSSFAFQILNKNGTLRKDMESRLDLVKGDFLNTEYIGINLSLIKDHHPLNNKKIRKALNYAIDRKTMLNLLKFNFGTPAARGFIPKGLPLYDRIQSDFYSYNPDTARSLIHSAGYNEKNPFPKLTIYTNKDYLDLITFITKQWEQIGIPVSIDLMETATLREKMRQSELEFFRASWIADYPDEESFFTVFYSKNPAPPNYTRFSNARFDSLYESAILQTNVEKRAELYLQMNQIILEEAPVIFLFYDQTSWFIQKHIHNLKSNPLNLLKLEKVEEYQ